MNYPKRARSWKRLIRPKDRPTECSPVRYYSPSMTTIADHSSQRIKAVRFLVSINILSKTSIDLDHTCALLSLLGVQPWKIPSATAGS